MSKPDREKLILIFAPVGRDAELARNLLAQAGISAQICDEVASLCREAAAGAGSILLTQEALTSQAIECLLQALDAQPPWSDLPLVVLVSRETPASVRLGELLRSRANATFLERPTGGATLVQAVEMALRARRRQYELREHLLALARAQEAEREARAVAEEAVQIRDEFLASVAHDLKNPLGAIKGLAQLTQRQMARANPLDKAKLVQHLSRIDGIATRAVAQIDELLDSARLQAGQPLPLAPAAVDLVALTQRLAADWQETTVSHRICVHEPPAELQGVWDPRRLERVISNLLGNAIKYSPRGGDVVLRLDRVDDSAVLSVQDGGIGIPSGDLPLVFDRFYRAANAADHAGTGLGLSGVRQIVEQHGGTVDINSDEGRGTTVTVRLPLTPSQVEQPAHTSR